MAWLRRWLALSLIGLAGAAGAAQGELEGGVNPGYHEPPSWFKHSFLDLRDDQTEAARSGRRLLLYFYQDGCPYCAKLLEENFGRPAIAEQTRRDFDLVAINIWGDREVTPLHGAPVTEKQFAEQMRVMFTPTLLFIDLQGRETLRLNGYHPPERFTLALDYAAGRAPAGVSFNAFVAGAGAPGATLASEPFFMAPPFQLDRRHATAETRPLLLLFEQGACPTCNEFHREVLARGETRRLLHAFDVVQLDAQGSTPVITPQGERTTARAWAQALRVHYAPTLIFFDARGQEVFRIDAYLRAFHVQSALEYVARGAYREQPNFQRFIEARADARRARGERVDIME